MPPQALAEGVGRFAGKQFAVPPPRSGRAPDAYFDKQVRSLAQGDRCVDAWIMQERQSRAPGEPVSTKPFHCCVAGGASIRQAACRARSAADG